MEAISKLIAYVMAFVGGAWQRLAKWFTGLDYVTQIIVSALAAGLLVLVYMTFWSGDIRPNPDPWRPWPQPGPDDRDDDDGDWRPRPNPRPRPDPNRTDCGCGREDCFGSDGRCQCRKNRVAVGVSESESDCEVPEANQKSASDE